MTGTFVNIITILLGTLIGLRLGNVLTEELNQRIAGAIGLVALVLGVELALSWRDVSPVYVLLGLLFGTLTGGLLKIEYRLQALTHSVQKRWGTTSDGRTRAFGKFGEAWISSSLLFCVGPLTIVGALEDGLSGDSHTLLTKALLDGITAVPLAATLGIGIAASAVSVLVIQGGISLASGWLEPLLHGEALAALTSTGGLLVIAIALKLLNVLDLRVGDMLPSLFIAPALVGLGTLVGL